MEDTRSETPPSVYVTCKWKAEELSGATVEFLRSDDERLTHREVGKFIAAKDPVSDRVEIFVNLMLELNWRKFQDRMYAVHQHQADAIELHPEAGIGNPPKAKFRIGSSAHLQDDREPA